MRYFAMPLLLAVVLFSFAGCCGSISEMTAPNRANLMNITVGMTKQQAIETIGTKPRKACYIDHAYNENIIIISNPYRSEVMKGQNGNHYEIVYYVTDDKNLDGAISDDELTPLVFQDNTLRGWGWKYLEENVDKHELRIR